MASIAELKKDFQKLIKGGNLAQGYIFFGHESAAEQMAFARELANFFERKEQGQVLSDALFLDANDGDGGIDVIRAASQFLWQRPVFSPKRFLVIAAADRLTLPAQNAILKISEEPPTHALIILMVKDPEVLLPAVASRFQKIFVCGDAGAQKLNTELAQKFLKAGGARRKELLKDLMEEIKELRSDRKLEELVTGLIVELRKDKIKNRRAIKELLSRWSLMRQFNVNKKLQLEVVLNLL